MASLLRLPRPRPLVAFVLSPLVLFALAALLPCREDATGPEAYLYTLCSVALLTAVFLAVPAALVGIGALLSRKLSRRETIVTGVAVAIYAAFLAYGVWSG